ncbi:hypothetical protein OIU74_011204 [Salix koriyanagi]|uniref:Uncharacterized protein n=1 Tax=Salix koriyanagi TaxID=2511006 RepID=A0A9Q0TEP1_9ROSI|nr:hypothetical protein OIU74_011204 [Salix koriyanagi]
MLASNPKTSSMVMLDGLFPVNHALNVPKLVHMTRDSDGAFLIKTIFFFCFLQQLYEQWVIEVYDRHYKSLLLLSLAHLDCQAPSRNISRLLPVMLMMKMRQVEVLQALFSTAHNHIYISAKEKKRKEKIEDQRELMNSVRNKGAWPRICCYGLVGEG